MGIDFRHPSDLFEDFQSIESENCYELIQFFEKNEEDLGFMGIEEQFIILCYYSNALFATRQFRKYLEYATRLLEYAILENLQEVDGVDVYLHTLDQKVQAHLILREDEEAIRIARQLLGLAPEHKPYQKLLRRALMRRRPLWVRQCFGAALWGAILWTGLEIIQLMYLETFWINLLPLNSILQWGTLLVALLSSVIGYRAHFVYVEQQVRAISKRRK